MSLNLARGSVKDRKVGARRHQEPLDAIASDDQSLAQAAWAAPGGLRFLLQDGPAEVAS